MSRLVFLEKPKTFTVPEYFDINNINLFCKIKDFNFLKSLKKNGDEKEAPNMKTAVSKIKKKISKNGSIIKEFKQNNGFGRYYYSDDSDSEGVLYLKNCVRGFISPEGTRDLDCKNCHPTILDHIMSIYDIHCQGLKDYVNNRESILNTYNIDKEDFLSMINDKYWKGENKFMKNIHIDIYNKLIPALKEDFTKLYELCKTNKLRNHEGSFISQIMQEYEQDIMFLVRQYFDSKNIKYGCLVYDGIHIYSNELIDFEELNKYIYDVLKIKVSFAFKEFDTSPIKNKIKEDAEKAQEVTETSELEMANKIMEIHQNEIKYCGKLWIKDFDYRWKCETDVIKDILMRWIIEYKPDYKISMIKNTINVINSLSPKAFNDDDLYEKFFTSSKGLLCFKNGYLCMKTLKFTEWSSSECDHSIYTISMINRDYEPSSEDAKQFIFDKVLNPIFNDNEEMRDSYLNYCARSLAGCTDKFWVSAEGERDSGKGILTALFSSSFGDYVFSFSTDNLILASKTFGDEQRNTWLEPFTRCRLGFGNESRVSNDSKTVVKFDGTKIKTIASGGDDAQVKMMRDNTRMLPIRANAVIFQQQMPIVDPTDALMNMLYFRFPCYFATEKRENEFAVYKKGDDTLKDTVKTKEYLRNAFVDIICSNYKNESYEFLKKQTLEYKSVDEECDSDEKIKQMFVFTKNPEDKLFTSTITEILKDNGITMNGQAIKSRFTTYGATYDKHITIDKTRRAGYIGVKLLE